MTCEGKAKFSTKGEAKRVANKRRRGGDRLNVYLCDCGSWHLGHDSATGMRDDGRYGARKFGVYVLCPTCQTFTARVGAALAKCESCKSYVLPGVRR